MQQEYLLIEVMRIGFIASLGVSNFPLKLLDKDRWARAGYGLSHKLGLGNQEIEGMLVSENDPMSEPIVVQSNPAPVVKNSFVERDAFSRGSFVRHHRPPRGSFVEHKLRLHRHRKHRKHRKHIHHLTAFSEELHEQPDGSTGSYQEVPSFIELVRQRHKKRHLHSRSSFAKIHPHVSSKLRTSFVEYGGPHWDRYFTEGDIHSRHLSQEERQYAENYQNLHLQISEWVLQKNFNPNFC